MATGIDDLLKQDRGIGDKLLRLGATIQRPAELRNGYRFESCCDTSGVIHQREIFNPLGHKIYSSNPDQVRDVNGQPRATYKQHFESADQTGIKPFAVRSETGALLELPVETIVDGQGNLMSATYEGNRERTVVERHSGTGDLRMRVGVIGEHHAGVFAISADRHGNMTLKDGLMIMPETSDAQIRAHETAERLCGKLLLSRLEPDFVTKYVTGGVGPIPIDRSQPAVAARAVQAPRQSHSNGFIFAPQPQPKP